MPMSIALAWIAGSDGEEIVVSPLRGLVRSRRRGTGWVVDIVTLRGRRHRITLDKGDIAPNDLGEGITQTLGGDLTVDGIRATGATVGVETRGWPL
jgi:hypothetical protein